MADNANDQRREPGGGGTPHIVQRATDWVVANRSNWVKGLLMLTFYLVFWLVKLGAGLIALIQLGSLLITGRPNGALRAFGAGLAFFAHDIVAYLTCATERLPFPFTEWPRPAEGDGGDW